MRRFPTLVDLEVLALGAVVSFVAVFLVPIQGWLAGALVITIMTFVFAGPLALARGVLDRDRGGVAYVAANLAAIALLGLVFGLLRAGVLAAAQVLMRVL